MIFFFEAAREAFRKLRVLKTLSLVIVCFSSVRATVSQGREHFQIFRQSMAVAARHHTSLSQLPKLNHITQCWGIICCHKLIFQYECPSFTLIIATDRPHGVLCPRPDSHCSILPTVATTSTTNLYICW